jgi:N-acetylmuramoyl-L-alanine amidase
MSRLTFILDPGHGGMIDGKYTTAPDKMWTFPDGTTIYEGVINRKIVSYIRSISKAYGIDVFDVTGGSNRDIPLKVRTDIANDLHMIYDNIVYCSIHCNAGKGKGTEIFTSEGQTDSDKHATIVMECLENELDDFRVRADYSDGDIDKEAKFWVLRKTNCPAWLLEVGFMDTREDANKLLDDKYLFRVAEAIVQYMKQVNLSTL